MKEIGMEVWTNDAGRLCMSDREAQRRVDAYTLEAFGEDEAAKLKSRGQDHRELRAAFRRNCMEAIGSVFEIVPTGPEPGRP
jgi:hypothetical protein